MPRFALSLAVLLMLGASGPGQAQEASPKYEFRGAWVATVVNLDWPNSPTGLSSTQQSELITILDRLQETGINAVIFQVRPEADALYESAIEPWSYWLTGEQGTAPDPFYDPLMFAVEEAHKRGMELHAWFNPFRASRSSSYPQAATHVTQTHPEWILSFGTLKVLDPGLEEVRTHVARVVADVTRRYDIDGVHFDDYFYPYPPDQITNEDAATFAAVPRGFTNIGDWRRDNVNLMVAQVQDSILAIDPAVQFGISPFGIWKNGVPSGIVGLDAYNVIYADATAWLGAQTIDYLTPQLYWKFGGGQDYGLLAPWWAEQAATNDRHLYPGHGLYRSSPNTWSGTLFAADEVPRQVRFNRDHPDIQGSVFFRAKNITLYSSQGFADSLETDLYRHPALTPVMEWKDQAAPAVPGPLAFEWTVDDDLVLTWSPSEAMGEEAEVRRYAVYRIRSATEPDYATALLDATNLLAVTGDTTWTDRPIINPEPYYYVVTAVSANSIESERTNAIMVEGRVVGTEPPATPQAFRLHPNAPNPFQARTQIAFSLAHPAPVTLRIHDVLGREIATLLNQAPRQAGFHTVVWEGTSRGEAAASGTYFITLEVEGRRKTRPMTLVR